MDRQTDGGGRGGRREGGTGRRVRLTERGGEMHHGLTDRGKRDGQTD